MGTHYNGTAEEMAALNAYIKLSRASESVTLRINQHLHNHNLTASQFGVLEALYHLGPMPVGQLGQKILRSSGNMTLVIDNLSRRGLVTRERRSDDRRSIEVSLTPPGASLIAEIMPSHVSGVVRAFESLSCEEQGHLAELCRRLGLAQAQVADTDPAQPGK